MIRRKSTDLKNENILTMVGKVTKGLKCFIILALLLFAGCGEEGESELISIFYEETLCSDPWGMYTDDTQLVEKLNEYFDAFNVDLFEVEIEDPGPQIVCLACDCKNGRIINAQVESEGLGIVTEKGFKIK